jgi:DnaJ-domain-containing protein 1
VVKTYAGLGLDTLVPRVVGTALPQLKVGAEEGFVLSRVDGNTTVGEICLLVPFDAEVTVTILKALRRMGAIDVPGAEPIAAEQPAAAHLVGIDLTVEQAERIDGYFASLEGKDAFELLEVTRAADKRAIKRAYFKLSKEFHPDRFFGQSIGPYKERLSRIFQSVKAAFELLSDDTRRAAYEQSSEQK